MKKSAIGLLTRERFGFYAGYIWFKEFHIENIENDDKGRGLMAGLDFMLMEREDFRWYVNLGFFNEKFISSYPVVLRIRKQVSNRT